jgi:hypothetical protein
MKYKTDGIPIIEFVGNKTKCYSLFLNNNNEKKTGKGI